MLKNLGWIICLYFCKNVCESFYFPYKAFTFWFLIHYIKSYNEKHYCFIWSLIILIFMYYWLFRASQSRKGVCYSISICLTSSDKLSSFVYKFCGHIIVTNELLETKKGQHTAAQAEVGADAQQHNQDWEVDIEAIRNDWNHIHVTHDLTKEFIFLHFKRNFYQYDIIWCS